MPTDTIRASLVTDGQFRPTKVTQVELSRPLPTIERGQSRFGEPYGAARILVRLHGTPVGTITVDLGTGPLSPEELDATIVAALGPAIDAHLASDERMGGAGSCRNRYAARRETPLVSVVVPTFHRPEMLARCVTAILASDHPHFEVVVVDNSPDDLRTWAVVHRQFGHDPRVRYVEERGPGPSRARNAGIAAARGDLIAFTDDDVVVDPEWIRSLISPLMIEPGVACSTGLTQPLELETEPQVWFEHFGGMGGGYDAGRFDVTMTDRPTVLFPFTPAVGASNNMAIRRGVVQELGGFDVRLGPGTPTSGGEDLDLFVRILLAGHRIAYEPRALVWHRHRVEEGDLRRHVFGYGVGSVAVLTKWAARRPDLRRRLLRAGRRLPAAFGPQAGEPLPSSAPPRSLARAQVAGGLLGPVQWMRSAHQDRRTR